MYCILFLFIFSAEDHHVKKHLERTCCWFKFSFSWYGLLRFLQFENINLCSLRFVRWDVSPWINQRNRHSKVCLLECLSNSPQATLSSFTSFWDKDAGLKMFATELCISGSKVFICTLTWGSTCFVGRTISELAWDWHIKEALVNWSVLCLNLHAW